MTLAEIANNTVVKVVSVRDPELEPALLAKLSALGFIPGANVQVVRRAPLGRSLQLKLKGGNLCLTSSLAQNIEVETRK
ncbi:FeoA family protein [Ferrimonas pelagia]|uniref:Ferrous iron transporter FeoA-like domain-containing protein n=1 Tax=Ferrimonas pelagia TaxID=1177826 RepID=A0ABP9ERL9_9GAMM